MNKLFISPSGVIKVIDVPEEPTVGGRTYQGVADPGTYNAMKSDYQRALAAAKEAGIEVQNREQVVREVFTRPVTGEIVSIPEGWRVETKRKTVAVLLPPVSEKEGLLAKLHAKNESIEKEERSRRASTADLLVNAGPVEKVESQEELREKIEFIKGAFQCFVGYEGTNGFEQFLKQAKFQITRKP